MSAELIRLTRVTAAPVLVVEGDGKVVSANPAAAQALGTPYKTLVGQRLNDLAVGPSEQVERALHACSRSGDPVFGKLSLFKADGSTLPFPYKGILLRPPANNTPALVWLQLLESGRFVAYNNEIRHLTTEIHRRKWAEEELRKSETRLKLTLDAVSDGGWDWNVSTGECFYSDRWLAALGYKPDDIEPHIGFWEGIVHPDDMPRVSEMLNAHFDGHIDYYECEARLRKKSGEYRWGLDRGRVVTRDAEGKPLRMVGADTDITDRKLVEEALRKSEDESLRQWQELDHLYRTIPVGLCVIDADFRFVRVNELMAVINGKPAEKHIGITVREVVAGVADQVEDIYRRVFESGEPILDVEISGSTPADLETEHHWLGNYHPVKAADGTTRWVSTVVVDITERKQAEEQLARAKEAAEAANIAKSEFLANMSHEIRTPMASIMGFTEMLLDDDLPEEDRRDHLKTIYRNSEALLTLINDILDLSKIEAHEISLEYDDCSVREIIEEVVTLMRPGVDKKKLLLEVEYQFPLPEKIRTAPIHLKQALVNLVGNAIKFTEKGKVNITVRLEGNGPANQYLYFDIADTGIGISQEEKACLFKRFSQVDSSHTRRYYGAGLGLCITKELAGMLGGDVTVHSESGKGSTFSLSIGVGNLDNVTLLSSHPQSEQEKIPHKKKSPETLHGRVLLVEDYLDMQQMLCFLLRDRGLEVDTANNGSEAIDKVLASLDDDNAYDLIVTDIQMPVMDGLEATRLLRQKGWKNPIIAMTAHAMSGDCEKCLDAGCDTYVSKPVKADELCHLLARYLDQ